MVCFLPCSPSTSHSSKGHFRFDFNDKDSRGKVQSSLLPPISPMGPGNEWDVDDDLYKVFNVAHFRASWNLGGHSGQVTVSSGYASGVPRLVQRRTKGCSLEKAGGSEYSHPHERSGSQKDQLISGSWKSQPDLCGEFF
jgi:hypothetical protein